jgi:shikimate dehydrogenase
MRTFGLIGKTLSHTFSERYFNEKFHKKDINDAEYKNFELKSIADFPKLIADNKLSGLNITIPYKESIIPFLDDLTDDAKKIGAVNTIQFIDGKTIGHNTDWIGFSKSIKPLLGDKKTALILGNGGGAKAIKFALDKLKIEHKTVNRNSSFDYSDISTQTTEYYNIIINTTPLGTHPKILEFPKINYTDLSSKHLLFDLIYNPNESRFLQYGKAKGSEIKNGLEMLQIQAEESWNIWIL